MKQAFFYISSTCYSLDNIKPHFSVTILITAYVKIKAPCDGTVRPLFLYKKYIYIKISKNRNKIELKQKIKIEVVPT